VFCVRVLRWRAGPKDARCSLWFAFVPYIHGESAAATGSTRVDAAPASALCRREQPAKVSDVGRVPCGRRFAHEPLQIRPRLVTLPGVGESDAEVVERVEQAGIQLDRAPPVRDRLGGLPPL